MRARLMVSVLALLVLVTLAQGAQAASPTAITGAVSAVGGTSATLNGTVNPGGEATDWWFEYGATTGYGSKTSTTAAGSGSANVSVAKSLSGLSPATTYHYRLVAKNGSGTVTGGDGIFTTASPPLVSTSPATGVSSGGATLGGTVNPKGQPTSWYVEYGTSSSYGSKTGSVDAGSGNSTKSVSVGIGSLSAGKTYHFRLVATSSAGTAFGSDETFATGQPATVRTTDASSVRSTSARLNGKVDPNGRSTTYFFEYGRSTSYGSKTSTSGAGSGTKTRNVSKTVNGLKPGTQYHFRLVASSDAGTVAGADLTFTTDGPPSVSTSQPAAVGSTSASLGGTINPNGSSTSWFVEYGTSTSYGSRTRTRGAGSGTSSRGFTETVSGLSPGVTYFFRIVAWNSLGTSRGGDVAFSTAGVPAPVTGPVVFTTLSLTRVRVTGTVSPQGGSATWWFEYGRTRSFGRRTAERTSFGAGSVGVNVLLTRLNPPGVRWYYRLMARSAVGTYSGRVLSFATPRRPRNPAGRVVSCTIVGTQAADVLRGTNKRDVICGLGGNDRIFGRGGNDIVYGGPGRDVIDGGGGNDILRGGTGSDKLNGRSGNDRLEGAAGYDLLIGGTGRDTLLGGSGRDTILARDGWRDVLNGGTGRDTATVDRTRDKLRSIERRRT